MERFRKLGIGKELMKVIEEQGFEKPSEIQEKAIPLVLAGKDVVGNSATGSGKTLAFGSVIIERCEKGKGLQTLVLTPTRELAVQVAENLREFSKYKGLRIQEIYGGVGMGGQVSGIEESEIVVGTPGRTLDHLRRGTLNLSKIKILVLDEADRMVDMGFLPDVEQIIKLNPKNKQMLLFSATITGDIDYIEKKYMRNPEHVGVESIVDPAKLNQHYYDVDSGEKFSLLAYLLKKEGTKLVMVFCNSRRTADSVARNLTKFGHDAVAIHGGLTQARREQIMKKFHSGKLTILVCTDVAARGLHIENVSHVYNYDIPKTSNDYIHRIGRTARAGESGDAISLVSSRDYKSFSDIQMEERIKIEHKELPEFEKVYVTFDSGRESGRFGGRGFRGRSSGGRGGFSERRGSSGGGFRGSSRGGGFGSGSRGGGFGGKGRGSSGRGFGGEGRSGFRRSGGGSGGERRGSSDGGGRTRNDSNRGGGFSRRGNSGRWKSSGNRNFSRRER